MASRHSSGLSRTIFLFASLLTIHNLVAQRPAAAPVSKPKHPALGMVPAPPTAVPTPTPTPAVVVPPPPPEDPLGRSSPYGCVIGFLQAVNNNDLALATQYLDTKLPEKQAELLATQLKAVLDASLSSSIDKLSRKQEGDVRDNFRVKREKIGVAKLPTGDVDVLLDRVQRPEGPSVWLFSAETLERIPHAYAHIESREPPGWIPRWLRDKYVFGVALWRWLLIALAIVTAIVSSSLAARLLLFLVRLILHLGSLQTQAEAVSRLKQPVRILLLSVALRVAETFSLSVLARHYWHRAANFFLLVGCAWLLMRTIDLFGSFSVRRLALAQQSGKVAIVGLTQRLIKLLTVIISILILLANAGVNVSAMLTGLGIGGIALALAAQKTLEDLFGGISLIVRETIRVGDYCRVGDQTGTIEEIGLSSTRLRTLERTVVSIPNSRIAEKSSENFTLRDMFLFRHSLELRADTPPTTLQEVIAELKNAMTADPNVKPGTARINLIGMSGASFRIECFAYVLAHTYDEFLIRQQSVLDILLRTISKRGLYLAFPSTTTYLAQRDALDSRLKEMSDSTASQSPGPKA